jgi:tetratricopeptide (TPR) repeat protein
MVHNRLGLAKRTLGNIIDDVEMINAAGAHFDAALAVYPGDTTLRHNAATIFLERARVTDRNAVLPLLQEAERRLSELHDTMIPDSAPGLYRTIQQSLGEVRGWIATLTGDVHLMRNAVDLFERSLDQVPLSERSTPEWADAQGMLGRALFGLGVLEPSAAVFERALRAADHAQNYYTLERAPILWQLAQQLRCVVLFQRALWETDGRQSFDAAEAAVRALLSSVNVEQQPELHARVVAMLADYRRLWAEREAELATQ